jgi:hypothetical protein
MTGRDYLNGVLQRYDLKSIDNSTLLLLISELFDLETKHLNALQAAFMNVKIANLAKKFNLKDKK